MPDNVFNAFGLTPSPAIDEAALKEQFARLSADLHPDKFQQKPGDEKSTAELRYTLINKAYQILRDPKERLIYLYELEKGEKPKDVQKIPPGTMDLFIEVGQLCQKADEFLKKRKGAASAVEKAALMAGGLELQDDVMTLQNKIAALEQQLGLDLAELDHRWRKGSKDFDQLEALYRKYSYAGRWKQQLEERQLALLGD